MAQGDPALPKVLTPAHLASLIREPRSHGLSMTGTYELAEIAARRYNAHESMLKALRVAKGMCEQCIPDEPDADVCDNCRTIRAAIAKAERGA